MQCGLKGREIVGPAFEATVTKPVVRNLFEVADDGRSAPRSVREVTKRAVLAALQAARMGCPFPQGIGLRPQPWAGVSRPVGPMEGFRQRF